MDVVGTELTALSTEALATIGTATALILGIPVAFKAISVGKRIIAKF